MGKPQQPELLRTGRSPVDPGSWEEHELHGRPSTDGPLGPVPDASSALHHPEREQDKPVELGGAGHGTGRRRRS
jgi:hypothetical protein